MNRFEVGLDWEVEPGVTLPLVVTGTQSPVIPAVRVGRPENWSPAEGGEIEIGWIRSGAMLTREQTDRLLDDDNFIEAVEKAVETVS